MSTASAPKPAGNKKRGIFARLALFIRQIIAEMKKVQRPSREEMTQMFVTVLVFVAVVMAFVGILDAGFGRVMFWIFG